MGTGRVDIDQQEVDAAIESGHCLIQTDRIACRLDLLPGERISIMATIRSSLTWRITRLSCMRIGIAG